MTSNPILPYSVLLVPPSFLGEKGPVPDLTEDLCLPLGLDGIQHQVIFLSWVLMDTDPSHHVILTNGTRL